MEILKNQNVLLINNNNKKYGIYEYNCKFYLVQYITFVLFFCDDGTYTEFHSFSFNISVLLRKF